MNKIILKPVVSYTTRSKRKGEIDGREHYFINPNQAQILLEKENVLAYTKIGDIEYFSTLESLNDSNLYIIDPNGINYIKSKFPKLNCKIIYIYTDNEIRKNRAKKRDNKDFLKSFENRNNSENDQFTKFENNKDWDLYLQNNSDIDFKICIQTFITFVKNISYENNKPLYLVAGRTGSGKDSICREVIKYFKEN